MTKYYKLNNDNELLYLIHKYYPNHPYLLLSPLNSLDSQKIDGLIDHLEYFTCLITKDKKQIIQESDEFDIGLNIFDILSQLEKLGLKETDYCECIYDNIFFDVDKKFLLFTDEEWNNFTKEALERKAIILTDDVYVESHY